MDAHMDHSHMHSGHSLTECDGTPDLTHKGSWKGHIIPGAVIVVWGCWMALQIILCHLRAVNASARAGAQRYQTQSWYPLTIANNRRLRYTEPILKIFLPILALFIELRLDHSEYMSMYCPAGTALAGQFALSHINNWQHAASYPAFILSGLVDLYDELIKPLPEYTSHSILSFAFAVMTFLMGTHEKHEPLDKMVHWLLSVAMLLATLMLIVELYAPRNVLISMLRASAVIFLGSWFIQVGRIEFEHHPAWNTTDEATSMGAVMMAPVFFSIIAVVIMASMLVFYIILYHLYTRGGLLSRLIDGMDSGRRRKDLVAVLDHTSSIPDYNPVLEMQPLTVFDNDSARGHDDFDKDTAV